MSKVVEFVRRNPVRIYAVLLAAIPLATAFGLGLSAEQVAAVTTFAAVVLGVPAQASVTANARLPLDPQEPSQ